MIEALRCEICDSLLTQEGLLASTCPRCLFSLASEPEGPHEGRIGGLDTEEPGGTTLRIPTVIGRYRILRLVSEGGMGAVFEAQQEYPHRTVALKLIKPGFTSLEMLRRFEQESEALGRLQHPGIAQIYEAGTSDTGYGAQPFFAMEFIHGETLVDYADTHRLSTRERLEIFARVCDAVHHAHQRGLIHRDLKPGNILVDETGQPRVLDFGVARLTDCDTQTTLQTGMGQLIGTLAYMSPEQALADPLELDIRSDVYALGVILYELLSARLPYNIGKLVHEALHAIREQDPARLSSIDRNYRGDIETIVAKALEKDKTRRYSSAAELGADIHRYLKDEPIIARAPSVSYQLQKFARRHKAMVGSIAAVFLVLAAGIVATSWMAVRARNAEELAVRDRDYARTAEATASLALDRVTRAEAAASIGRDQALRAGAEATLERNRTAAELDRIIWQSLARESLRLSATRGDDELAALLARQAMLIHARTPDEPRYLIEEALQQAARLSPRSRRFLGHQGAVNSVAFSFDGARLASGSADRTVRVLNMNAPDRPPVVFVNPGAGMNSAGGNSGSVSSVAISPDGTRLVSASGDGVKLWNLQDPAAPPLSPVGYQSGARSAVFSPDGTRVAFAEGRIWIWDWQDPGSPLRALPGSRPTAPAVFSALAFSPDGMHVAAGESTAGGLRIWDLRSAASPPIRLSGHTGRVNSLAFSPDGKHLASAGEEVNEIITWQPVTAEGQELEHWQIRIWDLNKSGAPPMLLSGQGSKANSVAFSKDGKLASAGHDGFLRLWDVVQPAARPAALLRSHEGVARSVTFSTDGTQLASAGNDYSVRVWNLRDLSIPFRPFKAHQANVNALAFSPNNALLVSGSREGTARVWDLRDQAIPPISLQHEGAVHSLAFSPDGSRLASATAGSVRVWNPQELSSQPVLLRDSNGFWSIRFSREGTLVTSTIPKGLLRLFIQQRGAPPPLFLPPSPFVPSVMAFKRWNLQSGTSEILLEDDRIRDAFAVSDDGGRLAASDLNVAWVWNLLRPNTPPIRISGHRSSLNALAFDAAGMRLASGGNDLSIHLWDLDNPRTPTLTLRSPDYGPFLKFLFDDTRLLAVGAFEPRLWDLREPGAAPVVFKRGTASILSVAVSHDGMRLAVGDRDGYIWVWNLWTAAADELCTRVSRNLSREEWRFYVESIPYTRTCPALPDGQ